MAGISLVTVLGYNLEIQINYEGRSAFVSLSLGYGSTKLVFSLKKWTISAKLYMHNAEVLPRHPLTNISSEYKQYNDVWILDGRNSALVEFFVAVEATSVGQANRLWFYCIVCNVTPGLIEKISFLRVLWWRWFCKRGRSCAGQLPEGFELFFLKRGVSELNFI